MKNRCFDNYVRIKNGLVRRAIRGLHLRPWSRPFISGDGFRKIADHIYDETGKCQAQNIKENEIVFVNSSMVDEFFQLVHPAIKFPYKLITHNSDRNIGPEVLPLIDEKIIIWFAQNVIVKHPKIIPIPIGIDNLHFYHNGVPGIIKKYIQLKKPKINRILFGFSIHTNPAERQPAFDVLSRAVLAEGLVWTNNPDRYMRLLSQYKFVASPPGNGLDAPREWQAMYIGVVPIVKRSVATEYFKSLNLPLKLINDWREVESWSEADLERMYSEILSNSDRSALDLDYWIGCIKRA